MNIDIHTICLTCMALTLFVLNLILISNLIRELFLNNKIKNHQTIYFDSQKCLNWALNL